MVKKTKEGFYQSTLLESIHGLRHGFSTRAFGDMRNRNSVQSFLTLVGLKNTYVYPQQTHGDGVITVINEKDMIPNVDGLVHQGNNPISLSVRVADCVPILATDLTRRIIGVAHAGWKGTQKNISLKLVHAMKKQGAKPRDIFVSVGPHIGICCYTVSEERASMFRNYSDDKAMVHIENEWHLDIGYVNNLQLLECGVTKNHIDTSPACTSCQVHEFFSFRKDTKESFGEMVGVIGFST